MSHPEFTGERVIPGEVNADLWNEHFARYAFAARFAAGARVLDVGCGTGYGPAELAQRARGVTGIDVSTDALRYAQSSFPLPNLAFIRGSAASLAFRDAGFDVVTAFEVIEHLRDWPEMIKESARVLVPQGLFLVSTPNKLYYADSRKLDGPNPFHEHEFEYGEFQTALAEVFPHVRMLLQNRTECFAFYPAGTYWPSDARIDGSGGGPEDAHFFLAICSHSPLPDPHSFAYIPKATNILREREQHIEKLSNERNLNREWIAALQAERDQLLAHLTEQKNQLEERNGWALQLDQDLRAAQQRIFQLQNDYHCEQEAALSMARSYEERLAELESSNEEKTRWALETERRLTADIEDERARHTSTLANLAAAEATIEERTRWALELNERIEQLEALLSMLRASRWIAMGRTLGLGPRL